MAPPKRTCVGCNQRLLLAEFPRNGQFYRTRCKPCYSRHIQDQRGPRHYTPAQIAVINASRDARRIKTGIYIRSVKESTPCADCGVGYPHYVMDFDHVRGTKFRNVSEMRSMSLEKIMDEIAKCEVVCANCHRARTHVRRTGKRRVLKRR